jgi:hypothetical protein
MVKMTAALCYTGLCPGGAVDLTKLIEALSARYVAAKSLWRVSRPW